jgi:hypothetical protein
MKELIVKVFTTIIITTSLMLAQAASAATAVDALLETYRATGAGPFRAEGGQKMWKKSYSNNSMPRQRSCASCHTSNLAASGKHIKTRKLIEPLAPSVNSKRLTSTANVEKWFKRNCKWTLGRECNPQEKGDFLLFIQNQ